MSESLENCLRLLHDGAVPERTNALGVLSNSMVFVPVRRFEQVADQPGAKKVRIVSDTHEGRKEVPVFTSEDNFFRWAKDSSYQCLSVAAGDLALTLPPDTWLVIDRGTEREVIVPPEELEVLAYPPTPSEPFSSAPYPSEAFPSDAFPSEATSNETAPGEAPHEQAASEEALEEVPQIIFHREEMLDSLRDVLERRAKIEEAYYIETDGGAPARMLGLLVGTLASEERFVLIEEIAEVSRRYLGEAGALEVYDDLHSPSSTSWELFNTQTPFFSRGSWQRDALLRDGEFAGEDPGGHGRESEEALRAVSGSSLWQQLRRRARFPFRGSDESSGETAPEHDSEQDSESNEGD